MNITGKVHCFFEQSGTFKKEFIKLGIHAEDYDIQDDFGETDHVVDLFKDIKKAWKNKPSIFDKIDKDKDLIVAFFPCIRFCALSQMNLNLNARRYCNKTPREVITGILKFSKERETYFRLITKLVGICLIRKIRIIIENPWTGYSHLTWWLKKPDIVDTNRTLRGDYMVKPTAFWFFNCVPTYGFSYMHVDKSKLKYFNVHNQHKDKENIVSSSKISGICSEERSMISSDYARNFICDFILGKKQKLKYKSTFD